MPSKSSPALTALSKAGPKPSPKYPDPNHPDTERPVERLPAVGEFLMGQPDDAFRPATHLHRLGKFRGHNINLPDKK